MKCIDFIRAETTDGGRMILLAAMVSGVANAALLAIINAAAQMVESDAAGFDLVLMFALAIALFIYSLQHTFRLASAAFESALHHFRVRIAKKLELAELVTVESVGREVIYNQLIKEADVISQTQQILVGAMHSAVMVSFIMIYIAWLSLPAFLITLLMTAVTSLIYYQRLKVTESYATRTTEQELEVIRGITDLLDGFKQVRVRTLLGEHLVTRIEENSRRLSKLKKETTELYNGNNIFAHTFFFFLIGAIVFILPRFIPTYSEVVYELTASILFVMGPLGLLVTAVPSIDRANLAVINIERLEQQLEGSQTVSRAPVASPLRDFNIIALEGIRYTYTDEQGRPGFSLGPLDLTIPRGELLFVIGGNGCGKSTFLKVLTGLYQPDEGRLSQDAAVIAGHNRQAYREQFSVIFGDFHLFDRLYGLAPQAADEVAALLAEMEIDHKTSFDGMRFSNLDLSTGQRKRLAMVVAQLERRPIFVFDEWAADQDPEFRQRFYTVILPSLIEQGKTVIAVTHDDHYFHLADRVLKLSYGRLEAVTTAASAFDASS